MDSTWWRDAVIYQIYIRSFADGDGDGLGDIAGIRSRLRLPGGPGRGRDLDQPVVPLADGRRGVRRVGLPRRRAAVRHARGRRGAGRARPTSVGLRVLLDIVPNHTSDQHAWFTEALASGPGSPARERYVFRPGRGADGAEPPNAWQSIFGGPAWARVTEPDGTPGEWYLHLFAPEQPDLNWEHPDVGADFERTLRFWFDRGVDGFRIDVAHSLIKQEGLPDAEDLEWPRQPVEVDGELRRAPWRPHPFWDRDEVHDVYRAWRAVADSYDDPQGVRRRGLGRRARAAGPLPAHRRAAHRLQLHLPAGPVGGRLPAARDRRDARRAPSGRGAGRPGCCPTTTSPGTCRATPGSRPCPAAA